MWLHTLFISMYVHMYNLWIELLHSMKTNHITSQYICMHTYVQILNLMASSWLNSAIVWFDWQCGECITCNFSGCYIYGAGTPHQDIDTTYANIMLDNLHSYALCQNICKHNQCKRNTEIKSCWWVLTNSWNWK